MSRVVVFSGAGISAESGLPTFRDNGGLWHNHSVYDVATPEAWQRDPHLVLDFYNARRQGLRKVKPNAAHLALAQLEQHCEVVVVTQNVDDLHERAGSSNVIHLHGELTKARSTERESLVYDLGDRDIAWGDVCELGSQLRPHVVWFGEMVHNTDEACEAIAQADRLLVVGTSLSVYPAAGFIELAPPAAERVVVAPELDRVPAGFEWLQGPATEHVPVLCQRWELGK
ncbi:NAD-dependent deacetylase [Litorivivens lipolytica]|uniref:NAD-dependent protein deacylase n=1 Tax=Litorivivens lipolytica TaxID=1524264 RepID=A0A7W4W552_9GAMM|nr:NAD-dependent deacylase [Litorivivens lipolytica]MBB3047635.1 NAD-dependent deacetylase [Litorivivens lipolytica]